MNTHFSKQLKHELSEIKFGCKQCKPFFLSMQQALLSSDPPRLIKPARNCCACACLRSAFLTSGRMMNPEKKYHLEFQLKTQAHADFLQQILFEIGHTLHRTTRKDQPILYLKESQHIEELLTAMGALGSVFDLMNIKIEKELRNNANRITNCETANIQKTVDASVQQVQDISFVLKVKGLDALSSSLQQAAQLRLAHPECSLSELCEETGGTISRSGLFHRLKKLTDMAQNLRDGK